ncbi:MAG: sigma-70 family RNA polymerase sigma factor [Acidobacteria bacterium]|nr:MAG: sigma-70 family RNA polymerase sigma factor [Acidobacteriota bacterium]
MSDTPRTSQFEAFVVAYQDMVFATAVRLLGRPADAEDVAQTVFLKAWERFDELSESPSAPGWLRTVATNLSLNHLTRHRRRWQLFSEMGREGEEAAMDPVERLTSTAESAPASLERAERDRALDAAVRRLPDPQRVPLVLFHFEDRSYQEIAELLGVSLGKVKTDIHRGRLALRGYLGDGSRSI